MKNLLITIAILTTPLTSYANSLCNVLGNSAELTMQHRQAGTDIEVLLEIAKSDKLLKAIVLDAYKKPYMETAKMKEKYVREFKNKVVVDCYKIMGD